MKKFLSAAMLSFASLAYTCSYGQGAGTALDFNNQPLTSTSIAHGIGTGDFTIEAWIKPSIAPNNGSGTGSGFLSNGSYSPALYASSGGTAPASGFGSFGMYWSGIGGASWKNSGVKLAANRWYHVAVVRSGTDLSFYVNGVKAPNSFVINATASMTNAPMRLGYSGDGSEYFNGNMDEVRLWGAARTQTELRNNMCHKLTGTEANLKVYYRLDEATGNALVNAVNPAVGAITMPVNAPAWVTSGAAIGDTSATLYASDYTAQSLSLNSVQNGNVTLSNISNVSSGMHLYRVDAVPNTTAGIPNVGTNNVYYGVFEADTAVVTAGSTYGLSYNYSNFPNALTFASGIKIYSRTSAAGNWLLTNATNNQTTHAFTLNGSAANQELMIGNFLNTIVCNTPTSLNAQNITVHTANLSWLTGGSNVWNVSWGAGSTFLPASGTIVHNLATTGYALGGLNANTTYSFYVQDSCTSVTGGSAWAGPYTFTTLPDLSMGSGSALYFNGNESIQSAAVVNHNIGTGDFTWEAWVNPSKITGSTCIMTNGNYVPALYATTAGAGGNGSVGFYWGGWKNSNTFIEKDKWSHVAMVRNHDTVTIYVNGIAAPNQFVMANSMANNKLRIGWSGDVSEYFQGGIDEVRVWDTARTQEELKADMCQKLHANEPGLINYITLNEGSGTSAADMMGTASFTAVNPARWRISGAPLGDTSKYIYPQDWNGVQLSLGSNAMGQFTLDSMANNLKGIHLYRVNNIPNSDTGIQNRGGTNQYFGVFSVGDYNTGVYKAGYNYATYPNAVANNANLHLYNRRDNAVSQWTQAPAANDVTNTLVHAKQNFGTRQFLLADFTAPNCAVPTAIQISNIDTGNATVAWTTAVTNKVMQYGDANFQLGAGSTVNLTGNTTVISALVANHSYEFYIKDSCSTTSTSAWVGPFGFSTLNPCPVPENVHADSIKTNQIIAKWDDNGIVTQDYTVSWGTQGFGDPNIGILNNVSEKRFALTGIQPNTAYDFYIRSNCNASVTNSTWAGPFTFSTIACDVPYGVNVQNPTVSGVTVAWISGGATTYNLQYGTAGFVLGSGTVVNNITTATYTLSGLNANTNYNVYVQDSCSNTLGSSAWVGPVSFKTGAAPTGISEVDASNTVTVYPNPANDKIVIALKGQKNAEVSIYNNLGQLMESGIRIQNGMVTISSANYISGVYLLKIAMDNGLNVVKRITVQH
jgi:hypothetical protein